MMAKSYVSVFKPFAVRQSLSDSIQKTNKMTFKEQPPLNSKTQPLL